MRRTLNRVRGARRIAPAMAFVLAALALPGLLGCEKQVFHLFVDFSHEAAYEFDGTGPFTYSATVTSPDIKDELDIPEDGRITRVEIKALSLRVDTLEGNEAVALALTGRIDDRTGPLDLLFENQAVPLVGLDVPYIGLNALIEAGITKLRNKINGFIDETNTAAFDIQVEGDSTPSGQRVHLLLTLVVDITVYYDQCLDMPAALTNGEPCEW